MSFFDENFGSMECYGKDSRYTYFVVGGKSASGNHGLSILVVYHRKSDPTPAQDIHALATKLYGLTEPKIISWADVNNKEDLDALLSDPDSFVVDERLPQRRYNIVYAYEDADGALSSENVVISSNGMFNLRAIEPQLLQDLQSKGIAITTTRGLPHEQGKPPQAIPIMLTVLDWVLLTDHLEPASTVTSTDIFAIKTIQ